MALPEKKRLKEIADAVWSYAVREDWGHRCAVCGNKRTEAHHLIPRQFEATRYDLRNGIALCARCHKFDPHCAPHQNPAGWLEWLEEHHPKWAKWYYKNNRPEFTGTKNQAYYIGVIRGLREYVPDEEFEAIVGVRLTAWMEETAE